MSYLHIAYNRTTLASAALLSLAILAGCQSTASPESKTPDVANTDPSAGALTGMPSPQQDFSAKLLYVGDRVHFALDRYDLSPEAEAIL
ncbi:MAG TPA: hypothetical protein VFE34_06030 [Dongiaceae bacterium]|jgi:hypothetical protein|nr:hypothetical protein [Dongiaceae bacterium]